MALPKAVTAEQFKRLGDAAMHCPTGATFVFKNGSVVSSDWGLAGLTPGSEYDPAEIKAVAIKLLRS